MTQKELQLLSFAHWFNNPWIALLFIILTAWSLVWKGIALWKAGRNSQMVWFIVILAVNTIGILEIIYIFFLSNKKEKNYPDNSK